MSASVALAFGGSRDIGAAIALRLAKGDFDVALTYLSRPDQAIDTVSALVQREERIVAAFEEIQRFVEKHGRAPQHGEDRDIFERLYAVRLDRLRELEECRFLLAPLDHQGLLIHKEITAAGTTETLDDDELLAELQGAPGAGGITELRHVRKIVDKRAAEEIANRTVSGDFEKFKPIFEQVKRDLKSGVRHTLPVQTMDGIKMAEIQKGQYFIVNRQVAYVAEVGGEDFRTQYDRRDSRLRVIYDNGTEDNLLMRSFQRALYRDATARLITDPETGRCWPKRPITMIWRAARSTFWQISRFRCRSEPRCSTQDRRHRGYG